MTVGGACPDAENATPSKSNRQKDLVREFHIIFNQVKGNVQFRDVIVGNVGANLFSPIAAFPVDNPDAADDEGRVAAGAWRVRSA